jgi:hypothetical protein
MRFVRTGGSLWGENVKPKHSIKSSATSNRSCRTCHCLFLLGAGAVTVSSIESIKRRRKQDTGPSLSLKAPAIAFCDSRLQGYLEDHPSGHSERERFLNGLEYHRSLLFDYVRRWNDTEPSPNTKIHNSVTWPRNVPASSEIPALELDLRFCQMSPNYRNSNANCQNVQFRIAAYYVSQKHDPELLRHGLSLLLDVANHGHPDGMCLYGTSKLKLRMFVDVQWSKLYHTCSYFTE